MNRVAAVWTARLDRPLTVEEESLLLTRLPPERRRRLERIRRADRRREPLCAYALLALALRETLGWNERPPMALTERGKPYFPDFPQVQFSLSHTDGAVLVGLSDRAIGVDIERIRPVGDQLKRRVAGDAGEEAFFLLWVRREARAKRSGAGIGTMRGAEPPLEEGEFYHALETFPGYAAGVACGEEARPGKPREVVLEDLLRPG